MVPSIYKSDLEFRTNEPTEDDCKVLTKNPGPFRQFANPVPFGVSSFALSTMVLSLINLRAKSVADPNIVVGLGELLL
jgi:succinate-acetate transporter protein